MNKSLSENSSGVRAFPTPSAVSARVIFAAVGCALVALVTSCTHLLPEETDTNGKFDQIADDFISSHYAFRPLDAVNLGWHQYDGKFVVPTAAAIIAEDERLMRYDAAFAALPPGQLTKARRHDLELLKSAIAESRWTIEVQRTYWNNPMTYANAIDATIYLKRDFKPLAERVADITSILHQMPALMAAARTNLAPTLPKAFVETAIDAASGGADFLENDVTKAAASVTDPAVRARFDLAKKPAVAELRGFVDWLKKTKLPHADGSFAVGRPAYVAMLQAEYITISPEDILEAGLKELRAEQQRFTAAARIIDPTKTPARVFESIQHEHPTAAGLIPDARKDLDMIRSFVVDNKLVTIPSPVRARVEETPPPLRSTSFASMDTPGPFETKATEAYYYITPVEANWTAKQAEEWLSAFSYYDLDVTSIHEAYPGHYVQFLALNASKASKAAKVFSSYPFVEGWAHYTEQMMIEAGFGEPAHPDSATHDEMVKAAKFRLAQSDEALLRICRLCCSIKFHTQGMTVDQATRFFMDNCYYEEKPARSEATRGTYDPGYLYYTLGKLMIYKLRDDWEAQEGSGFTLQRFHDEFLRHGAPPIPVLREIMLKNPKLWPQAL